MTTRSQKRRATQRSRGQALLEFALIAPLFIMLIFGVVEYSLINASVGAYNFAAKEAARYEAIIGNGSVPSPYTNVDEYVVNQIIVPHVNGLVIAQMTQVTIFKASQSGTCSGGATPPNCTTEVILTKSGSAWTCGSSCSNWSSMNRNDQLSNADYIGVYIAYTYTYLTAFFAVTSPKIDLGTESVQRIEPQQYGQRPHAQPIASVGEQMQTWFPVADLLSRFDNAANLPRHSNRTITGARA